MCLGTCGTQDGEWRGSGDALKEEPIGWWHHGEVLHQQGMWCPLIPAGRDALWGLLEVWCWVLERAELEPRPAKGSSVWL